MSARKLNLIVLVILVLGISVVVAQNSRHGKASKATSPPEVARGEDNSVDSVSASQGEAITNVHELPRVPKGQLSAEPDEVFARRYTVTVGTATWSLNDTDLTWTDGEHSADIKNPNGEAGFSCGLAFDSKRNQLAVSSLGGEGYLDRYDLSRQEWLPSVSLRDRDIDGLVYSPSQDCYFALNKGYGDEPVTELLRFGPDGTYQETIKLSSPLLCRVPVLQPEGEALRLLAGGQESIIDPRTGQVKADFVTSYAGKEAVLVAIYEATGNHHHRAPFEVKVESTAPTVLVLNSYEPVEWNITGGEQLERVVVSSYYHSTVKGLPPRCRVSNRSYEEGGEYLETAHQIQSSEMHQLLSQLEQEGIGVSSIAAAYQARSAVLR